jgi:hypothetical protein
MIIIVVVGSETIAKPSSVIVRAGLLGLSSDIPRISGLLGRIFGLIEDASQRNSIVTASVLQPSRWVAHLSIKPVRPQNQCGFVDPPSDSAGQLWV